MFLWGINVVAIKLLVAQFPPLAMQSVRIFIAGTVAIIVLYFLKDLRKLSKREWFYTILAAVFGQLLHHSLLANGLVETTASNASLILGLIPLTTVIFATIFLHDNLSVLRFIGIMLGFFGVAIVVLYDNGSGIGGISRGDIFVFLSMISQAFSFILIRKLTTTLSSRQLTAVMLLVGSLMLLVVSLILDPQGVTEMASGSVSGFIWIILLLSAVFATSLGHIIYNAAIQKIGAGETAIFNNFVPFFALIGSFIFLGEPILLVQIVGFVFIVSGVLLGTGYIEMKWKKRISLRKKNAKQGTSA